MKAGLRDTVVSVERRASESTDSFGNPTDGDWQEHIGKRHVHIRAKRGGERVLADGLAGVVDFEVHTEWTVEFLELTERDRFVIEHRSHSFGNGTKLNILHPPVDPTGKRKMLMFQVKAGTAT